MLGSVADEVVRNSRRPVLMVRRPEGAMEEDAPDEAPVARPEEKLPQRVGRTTRKVLGGVCERVLRVVQRRLEIAWRDELPPRRAGAKGGLDAHDTPSSV